MDKKRLFNSKSDPIPEVRRDLQIIPVQENGNSYLYFHDERGYATPDMALKQQAGTLLSLIDGRKSINDLEPYLGDGVSKDQVLQFIQVLDENRLLASTYFQEHADKIEEQYEQSTLHTSVTAGESYPDDPKELTDFLDEAFAKHDNEIIASEKTKALYAPHIDPRVALDSFVTAFAPIRNLEPKRVVVLATSHYAGFYPDQYDSFPFILVNKDFELPFGTIERDQQFTDEIHQSEKTGITRSDRVHRMEHSIELHLLFLSYLWDHEFKIVPFLTRDLEDIFYMEDSHLGKQISNFSSLLHTHFGDDDETFFLISGDLSHVGKKFGDQFAASAIFEDVKKFDQNFLDLGSKNHRKKMLELMKKDLDPYRICGFPPLYTFLHIMPHLKGKILRYDLWDEHERESAVSFGSILYSKG